ncbi:MAG: GWxTD domain-containing protein [Thermoanaerobaculia bacterium]|nr:GWxTD domain-containing protein [Thermoanaerobaculia bacterium]
MNAGCLAIFLSFSLATQFVAFRDWHESPEAYFMTEEERREWKCVETDKAAIEFIRSYYRKRGPRFRRELGQRIELADELFTTSRARGAATLSGKILIVLGEPEVLRLPDPVALERSTRFESGVFSNARPFESSLLRKRDVFPRAFVYRLEDGGRLVIEIDYDRDESREIVRTPRQSARLESLMRESIENSIVE